MPIPIAARAVNQRSMTGPKTPPIFCRAVLLQQKEGEQDATGERHNESVRRRGRHGESFHGGKNGDGRGDDAVAIQQRRAAEGEKGQRLEKRLARRFLYALAQNGQQNEGAAFAIVVRLGDETNVLDGDDHHETPENQGKNPKHVDLVDRHGVRPVKAFPERVKRAGADVAEHDAQRRHGHGGHARRISLSFVRHSFPSV